MAVEGEVVQQAEVLMRRLISHREYNPNTDDLVLEALRLGMDEELTILTALVDNVSMCCSRTLMGCVCVCVSFYFSIFFAQALHTCARAHTQVLLAFLCFAPLIGGHASEPARPRARQYGPRSRASSNCCHA